MQVPAELKMAACMKSPLEDYIFEKEKTIPCKNRKGLHVELAHLRV